MFSPAAPGGRRSAPREAVPRWRWFPAELGPSQGQVKPTCLWFSELEGTEEQRVSAWITPLLKMEEREARAANTPSSSMLLYAFSCSNQKESTISSSAMLAAATQTDNSSSAVPRLSPGSGCKGSLPALPSTETVEVNTAGS